jgi:nitroreductase
MDTLMDIIKKRISIRVYQDKSISESEVNSIMEAAKYAPSAMNAQQLKFKVISNKDLIQKLSDQIMTIARKEIPAMPVRPSVFHKAPLLIIITGPRENIWIDTDAALAAQNMMLYAASINLGSCFIGMAKFLEKDTAALKELHIADNHKIAAAVVVGFPAEKPVPKEKFIKVEYFK